MPHMVRVNKPNTTLPNGGTYQVGASVILSNEQYARLQPTVFTNTTLVDQGSIVSGIGITSINPTTLTGSGGTGNLTTVVTGVGFTGATAVTLTRSQGTIAPATITNTIVVNSDTQITVTILKSLLAGATGNVYDMSVTTPNGQSTLPNALTIGP